MRAIDPVDIWLAVILVTGYSMSFLALELEFYLRELKARAEQREIQRAIRRRQLTGV